MKIRECNKSMRHLFFLIAPQIDGNLHLYFVIHWAPGKSQGSLLTFIKWDVLPLIFSLQHYKLKHFNVCCRVVKLYIAVLCTVKGSKAATEKSARTELIYKERKNNISIKAVGFKWSPSNSREKQNKKKYHKKTHKTNQPNNNNKKREEKSPTTFL